MPNLDGGADRVYLDRTRDIDVFELSAVGMVITDRDGCLRRVNTAFADLLGRSREELIGASFTSLTNPDDAPRSLTVMHDLLAGTTQRARFEKAYVRSDGSLVWVDLTVRTLTDEAAAVVGFLAQAVDVTARRAVEEELIQAEEDARRLAMVARVDPTAVVIADPHGCIQWVNDAFTRQTGYPREQAIGRNRSELLNGPGMSPAQRAAFGERISHGKPAGGEFHLTSTDGRPYVAHIQVTPIIENGVITHLIGIERDVTERHRNEERLAHASRLESIGQLAAGIAHEINTPVQYIASNTSFLVEATADLIATVQGIHELSHTLDPGTLEPCRADLSDGLRRLRELVDRLDLDVLAEDVPSSLRDSQEGLTRLIQIVRAMKDFAHPGTSLEDTDINQAVESTIQVCRNEWKYVASLHLDLAPGTGLVRCYAGELKQVILNIVVNAAQALAEQRAADRTLPLGSITVSTRREEHDVVIRITDDGPGMPESVRQRIFDPFFTTKSVGKGTGQGLSHARSVVVGKHHGSLEVTSAPGQGAEFVIRLPLHAAPSPDDPAGGCQ